MLYLRGQFDRFDMGLWVWRADCISAYQSRPTDSRWVKGSSCGAAAQRQLRNFPNIFPPTWRNSGNVANSCLRERENAWHQSGEITTPNFCKESPTATLIELRIKFFSAEWAAIFTLSVQFHHRPPHLLVTELGKQLWSNRRSIFLLKHSHAIYSPALNCQPATQELTDKAPAENNRYTGW